MEPIEFITPTDGYFCFYWSSDNYVCGQEIAGNVIDYESGNLIYDQNADTVINLAASAGINLTINDFEEDVEEE